MYTAYPYFRVRVLANKKVKISLNLLIVFLEKNLGQFYFIAHTGRASAYLPLLAYHLYVKCLDKKKFDCLIAIICYFD